MSTCSLLGFFRVFFHSFLSLFSWYSHCTFVTPCLVVPWFLAVLFLLFAFLVFFPLWFSVWRRLLLRCPQAGRVSPSRAESTSQPVAGIPKSAAALFIASISSWFFLRMFISLRFPAVLACCVFYPLELLAY